MGNDIKTSQPAKGDEKGISFSEIHSDEPHEAVNASKTEVSQKHTAPSSHLSNKDDVFNVSRAFESGHIEAGTIVSDKKGSRPSFGENILSAFSEWWGKTKNTIDDSAAVMQKPIMVKKAEPLVSKVETRVDVVKTAATHATLAPKDDHKMVIQKIRTFKQDVARVQNAGVIVKEVSKKNSSWTHTEEKLVPEVKKIEPDILRASVASEQKMIPTPLPHTPPRPTVPTPKPVPPKTTTSVQTSVQSMAPATPLQTVETAPKSAPRITVPDGVVKKEISLPKKNIWVAPRVQPESSVLIQHSTPTHVSQSYIPSQAQAPTLPQNGTVEKNTPSVAEPTPLAPIAHNSETPPRANVTMPLVPASATTSSIAPVFHTVPPQSPSPLPKVADMIGAPRPSVPVSQNETPTSPAATTPQSSPSREKLVPQHAEGITVLTEISKILPDTTHTPITPTALVSHTTPIPKVVLSPLPVTHTEPTPTPKPAESIEPRPSISEIPVQRATPLQVHKPMLYKKEPVTPTVIPAPRESFEKSSPHSPATFVHKTPPARLQEIPKPLIEETGGYANFIPNIEPAPTITHIPEATHEKTFVPLPRPQAVVPPQPVFETTPRSAEKEVPTTFEAPAESYAPRIPTSEPLPSRPIATPPLERVISTPVHEQRVSDAPSNKAFRSFVRWAIIVCIILLGIALALFASIYFNVSKKEIPVTEAPVTVPTFIETNKQIPLMLEGTKESFLMALKEQVTKAGPGLTQFYPTVRVGETTRPGSTAEILGFLNTHIDERTQKSLGSTIMIGSIVTSKNEPFLVLQSTNFDILFTGLLAWESNLYTDLAPLFGENTPTKIKFKDAVRDNTSTRILYDDAGNEILLYSFINQKTVVITTSGAALSELIKQF